MNATATITAAEHAAEWDRTEVRRGRVAYPGPRWTCFRQSAICRETEKAVCVKDFGINDQTIYLWIPKSCIEYVTYRNSTGEEWPAIKCPIRFAAK